MDFLDGYRRIFNSNPGKISEIRDQIEAFTAILNEPDLLRRLLHLHSQNFGEWVEICRLIMSIPDKIMTLDISNIPLELCEASTYHSNWMNQFFNLIEEDLCDEEIICLSFLAKKWVDRGFVDLLAKNLVKKSLYDQNLPMRNSKLPDVIKSLNKHHKTKWIFAFFDNLFPGFNDSILDCGNVQTVIQAFNGDMSFLPIDDSVLQDLSHLVPYSFNLNRIIAIGLWLSKTDNGKPLIKCFGNLVDGWSDGRFVWLDNDLDRHRYISCFTVILCSFVEPGMLVPKSSESFLRGVSCYLDLPDGPIRLMGLSVAEILAEKLFSDSSNLLDFELDEQKAGEITLLRRLKNVKYDVQNGVKWNNDLLKQVTSNNSGKDAIGEPSSDAAAKPLKNSEVYDSDDELDLNDLPDKPTVKPPKNIAQGLEYLKKGQKEDDWERLDAVLRTLPRILSSKRLDKRVVQDLAPQICHRMLFLHNNFNLTDFENRRKESIEKILYLSPSCGPQIIDAFWNNKNLGFVSRLEILDFLVGAAKRLTVSSSLPDNNNFLSSSVEKMVQNTIQSHHDTRITEFSGELKASKTRYFHPISSSISQPTPFINPWSNQMASWILPLCRGLWSSNLEWMKQQAQIPEPEIESLNPLKELQNLTILDENRKSEKKISQTTAQLFSKLIMTISLLIRLGGPFSTKTRDCLRELGQIIGWFWDLAHNACLDGNYASEISRENSPRIKMINIPHVRSSILYSLHTGLKLSEENPLLSYESDSGISVLPLDWIDSIKHYGGTSGKSVDAEGIVSWLVDDIWKNDSEKLNRQMAGDCLGMIKERLESRESYDMLQ